MKKQDHIRPMTQKKKHYSEKANRPKKKEKTNKQTRIRVHLFKKTFAFPFAIELQ
jgi:hypothetical protein